MSSNTNTDILVAGAVAAFAVDLLVYPLDTIKTRIQSPDYKRIYINASTNTVNKSLLFRGVYQGIGSVVIATVPSSGAFFTTYEGVKSLLTSINPTSRNGSPLIPLPILHSVASSTAELVSCFILTPAEVLKQNAQMVRRSPSHTTKAFDGSATMVALRKFKKLGQLWTGYTALAARNLPFTAMQFPMFEHFKKSIKVYRERHKISSGTLLEIGIMTAISAGTAGSIAAVITTPIDVVKTRIMLAAGSGGDEKSSPHIARDIEGQSRDAKAEVSRTQKAVKGGRSSAFAIGRDVMRTEGIKGLFRGGALRGIWTALGMGLYLGVYESGRSYLESRRKSKRENEGLAIV